VQFWINFCNRARSGESHLRITLTRFSRRQTLVKCSILTQSKECGIAGIGSKGFNLM
jgi:hypothetical protein